MNVIDTIHRLGAVLIGSFMPVVLFAQITLEVRDARDVPLPNAHVHWQVLDGTAPGGMEVLDGSGVGRITPPAYARSIALRISFVGYRSIVDTVPAHATARRYILVPDVKALPEFVVTGQYAPATAEQAVHRVRVLDATTIQRMAANNLADVLRNELNIRLSQDNMLGTSLSMQGLGGQNVKILVDGVPVIGRQDGNIDLAQLDLTGVERVEVVEGPLSVNFGTNALAGTINLITRKRGGAPATLRASAYVEHIGRLNTTVSASRQWGRNDVVLTAGRNFFAGWDPRHTGLVDLSPAPADTTRVQQWKPREQYFGRFSYRHTTDRWDVGYKAEGMHDVILNRGLPRAPYNETAFDERYTTLRLDHALTVEHCLARGRKVSGLVAHNRYLRYSNRWFRDLTTLGEQLVDGPSEQDTSGFTLTNVRANLIQAREGARINYEAGIDVNVETGSGPRIGDGREEIGDYALLASAEYRPHPSVTLRPGLRHAYNTRYGAPLLPSFNMRWQLNRGFTWRASYAKGFRAPSLKELYLFFVDVNHDIQGNTGLAAERSHHWSTALSYRQATDKGVYTSELSLFHNRMDDLITLVQVSGARFTYDNIGTFETTSGSVGAGWDNDHWAVSTGVAVTGRYDAVSEAADMPQLFTTEVRASLTRQWLNKGWSTSLFWKWQDRQVNYTQQEDGSLTRTFIGAFHMADATITKRLWNGRLALSGGAKNLFNVQDIAATLSGGVHGGGVGANVPMATGRLAFARVELLLKRSE